MPFTLAHPAVVLPLGKYKSRFSLTALLAGSLVPDFEFFFQMREVKNIGHQWYGIALFDLPFALGFCYLFHGLLRYSFIPNLPPFFAKRFADALFFDWKKYAAENKLTVLISLLVGIISHILWDGFTHYNGMFVMLMPALSAQTGIPYLDIPVFYFLQIFSSLAGMLIVLLIIKKMPLSNNIKKQSGSLIYWFTFSFFFLLIIFPRLYFWPAYNSFWGIIMAVMGSICYAWVATALLFYKKYKNPIR
jgi:Domain of unknown function (DUF4184)